MNEEPFILTITKKQNKEFYDRINPRNRKEGKIIIAKYDWRHRVTDMPEECINDFNKFEEAINLYLKKRQEFLNLMALYL